ncbi:MAG: class I SAM-dependent methyltransferase [Clostridia bacterium]|nr:class I SAM-dependent methyltransferase [Clostridia bacterium]
MQTEKWTDYEIIASGNGEKLERWGSVYLLRPDPQAIWSPPFDLSSFPKLNAVYERSTTGGGKWRTLRSFPSEWTVSYGEISFLIKPMGFKHTGLFPEQAYNWDKMSELILKRGGRPKILNLFGYTGGASVALAKIGARVTHVDAAKNMVERCKQNAELSKCPADGIRYIVDDCNKFVAREIKRGNTYDGILMDPPSYGRGPNGETWKLEDNISALVEQTAKVLSDNPLFFLINSYTTGLQPTVMENILKIHLPQGNVEAYEVTLPTSDQRGVRLPCGCSAMVSYSDVVSDGV